MKTVTIPFDLELAKKIQNGEVEGEIVDKRGINYEIVKWDASGSHSLICTNFNKQRNITTACAYTFEGKYVGKNKESDFDLQLVVPEYLTWKEGDYLTIKHNEKTYIIIYKTYTVTEGNHPINYHVLYNVSRGELFFNECATKFLDITPLHPLRYSQVNRRFIERRQEMEPGNETGRGRGEETGTRVQTV